MTLARSFALASLALLAALLVLVSSQHRARLIAGAFQPVDSLARLGPDDTMRFMFARRDAVGPEFQYVIAEVASFEKSHPIVAGDALPALDQPDTCLLLLEEGKKIHCYNADIGVCSMLAKQHVLARLWDITGPSKLGGDGHNLIEVFDAPSNAWKALDPYYHCYFTLASMDSVPIGVPALRLALLETPSEVRLMRYVRVADDRADSDILAELRFLVPGAMLHANNDFRWRYANRYGWLMPIAPLIDKLPLRATRGVRTLMLGSRDLRYIIEDSHSPHYSFVRMKWFFWSLVCLFGMFCSLAIITALFARKKTNRGSHRRKSSQSKLS